MSNLIDYVAWRGDIDFDYDPLNEIDSMIFCQLSYLDFGGLVPEDGRISLENCSKLFFESSDFEKRSNLGALINPLTVDLFRACASSRRFSSLYLSNFRNIMNEKTEEQFSAISFSFGCKWTYAAFRGTDDTLVGWKEDFNLAFMDSLPSQKDAALYLDETAESSNPVLYVGGHSKGGNLAVYAASKCSRKNQDKISLVFSNDGPGFQKNFFEESGFMNVSSKICSIVPEFSVVGMLFGHDYENTHSVKSDGEGLMQHDAFNWNILGTHFVYVDDVNKESKFVSKTVNGWFLELDYDQRYVFVETIFSVLRGTNFKTALEFSENPFESFLKIVQSSSKIDRETSDKVTKAIKLLGQHAFRNIRDRIFTPEQLPQN